MCVERWDPRAKCWRNRHASLPGAFWYRAALSGGCSSSYPIVRSRSEHPVQRTGRHLPVVSDQFRFHVSFEPCVGRQRVRELHDCQERALRPRGLLVAERGIFSPEVLHAAEEPEAIRPDRSTGLRRAVPPRQNLPPRQAQSMIDPLPVSRPYSASAEKRLPPDRSTAFPIAPVNSPYSAPAPRAAICIWSTQL